MLRYIHMKQSRNSLKSYYNMNLSRKKIEQRTANPKALQYLDDEYDNDDIRHSANPLPHHKTQHTRRRYIPCTFSFVRWKGPAPVLKPSLKSTFDNSIPQGIARLHSGRPKCLANCQFRERLLPTRFLLTQVHTLLFLVLPLFLYVVFLFFMYQSYRSFSNRL